MRNVVVAACMILFSFSAAKAEEDLSADQLKAIIAKPHSDKLKLDELKIYPAARKFDARVKTTAPDGETTESEVIKVDEKWVDGVYIISSVHIPNADPLHFVVTFDQKAGVYRKWILLPNDMVIGSIGVCDGKSRTLSWAGTATIDGKQYQSVGQETHSDKKTTWTEVTFADGKLVSKMVGEATVTDP